MTPEELEHTIRAACEVAGDESIYIFGSEAILGQFAEAPADLRQSVEVDVAPQTRVDRVDHIDRSLGEGSTFHRTFGFYVHGLPIEAAALPAGWQDRVIPVRDDVATNGKTGLSVEAHDLAASKLVAFRDRDRDFARGLLKEKLIKPKVLEARIRALELSRDDRDRLVKWVKLTAKGLRARRTR